MKETTALSKINSKAKRIPTLDDYELKPHVKLLRTLDKNLSRVIRKLIAKTGDAVPSRSAAPSAENERPAENSRRVLSLAFARFLGRDEIEIAD